MKLLALVLALLVAAPAFAQEKEKKKAAPKKMPVAKGHSKPSPEQIRKFNDLQKKQK